jgi:hypothetical protein
MSYAARLLSGLGIALLTCRVIAVDLSPPLMHSTVEPGALEESAAIERHLDIDSESDPPAGTPWFVVVKGTVPVIISAPHATQPFREGKFRFSDGGGTAALAVALSKATGASVIYTQYRSPSDPNYYDDNDFKRALRTLIEDTHARLVLDIHGSSPKRPYDVDFGTLNGKSVETQPKLLESLSSNLRTAGIMALSDNFFAASQHETVTRFCTNLGVPAAQLEINSTWLLLAEGDLNAHRFAQLLQGLSSFIHDYMRSL